MLHLSRLVLLRSILLGLIAGLQMLGIPLSGMHVMVLAVPLQALAGQAAFFMNPGDFFLGLGLLFHYRQVPHVDFKHLLGNALVFMVTAVSFGVAKEQIKYAAALRLRILLGSFLRRISRSTGLNVNIHKRIILGKTI